MGFEPVAVGIPLDEEEPLLLSWPDAAAGTARPARAWWVLEWQPPTQLATAAARLSADIRRVRGEWLALERWMLLGCDATERPLWEALRTENLTSTAVSEHLLRPADAAPPAERVRSRRGRRLAASAVNPVCSSAIPA